MSTREQCGFGDAFERHFDAIYGYVAYRLAPDFEGAKDVVQDVFLAALQNWSSFRNERDVGVWLRGIARHKVADYFRARTVASAAAGEPVLPPLVPSETGSRERARLVGLVMRELPNHYADLLEEKHLDELSAREMGLRHGQTEKAIESALVRARQAFRETYERLLRRWEGRR